MIRPRLARLTAALLPLAACTGSAPTSATRPAAAAAAAATSAPAATVATPATPAATAPAGARHYGAPLGAAAPLPLATVLARPDEFAGKDVVVDGKVRANCTNKGCWMELAGDLDPAAAGCRVTFKDYGFFVPVNSRGASARVEGQVAVKTIAAPEVAHLEGEGGHFPVKLADGSAREVRIVASGVELRRARD